MFDNVGAAGVSALAFKEKFSGNLPDFGPFIAADTVMSGFFFVEQEYVDSGEGEGAAGV